MNIMIVGDFNAVDDHDYTVEHAVLMKRLYGPDYKEDFSNTRVFQDPRI
jgi:hypothetical protein